ncbi:LytTR family DNA-binding domain-containing protein [Companilactobacillus insicii]|uniref:LytTR family DNA-binding domain-containing protein n=1 Tax=Companilactobacillus insicii TaxID=1732567 RepID=UPI000F7A8FDF|nr:LytTR family DNA-binding domain-containing protein [Companilactobacillus insicii]
MKINFEWDDSYSISEVGIKLNPKKRELKDKLKNFLSDKTHIEVINPKNNRRFLLSCSQILSIEAMDNLSKVYTTNNEIFYTNVRLKKLEEITNANLFRINNSVILNLAEVIDFNTGKYARLEVHTKGNQSFIVSRYYAKRLKEELGNVQRIE